MKKLLLLLSLTSAMALRAGNFETTYGIGILHVDLENTTELTFYTEADLSKTSGKTINFSYDKKAKTASLTKGNETNWLAPEILDPAHKLFTMRCLERANGWFKVVTDNRSNTAYWVKGTDFTSFNTWLKEIGAAQHITRVKKEENPLRKAANSNVIFPWDIKWADCFRPTYVQGNWVKIETRSDCADGVEKVKEAWIRWRDDDTLLINYSLVD